MSRISKPNVKVLHMVLEPETKNALRDLSLRLQLRGAHKYATMAALVEAALVAFLLCTARLEADPTLDPVLLFGQQFAGLWHTVTTDAAPEPPE